MRKGFMRGVCAALLTVMSVSLTGCHGSKGIREFEIPEEFDTSREIELTFWAKNDTNMVQTAIYKKAIEDFQTLYPNVTVNMRLYSDYGKIYNDVITNLATGTTPNVCITYPDHIATYLTGSNTVVPLDALFEDPKYGLGGSELRFDGPTLSEMIPKFLEECSFSGAHYAVPYMRSTEACYVNKTYVEAMGYELPEVLTWDFIWEVSEAAMEQKAGGLYAVNDQDVMIPFIYKSTDNMMITMLRQLDAGYSTPEGDIEIFNDSTKEILLEVAKHVGTGAFSTFKISGYPGNFFNAGQCIFAVDSTAGSTWIGSEAPLADISDDRFREFETVVMEVPQFNPDDPKMISQGPSVCVFNKKDPQEVLASWLFVQFLLTNDVQNAYAQTEGYVPVTSKAQNSPEYQDYLSRRGEDNTDHYAVKIDASRLLLEHVNDSFVTPVFNGSASLRSAASQLIEEAAKSVRRKQNVDAAYIEETIYPNVTSLYRLDQLDVGASAGGKQDLGPLPTPSKLLIGGLLLVWACLGAAFFLQKRREKGRS